ncbi:MAG: hypothetical protein JWQ81_4929 [Amycolatopsis sp.]|uniref:YoaK family protein n=1 Tax=Amycolatopsis sp. TaxID=37632 RepID=UPI002627FBD7|nr:YoaK family protein [Amycolatopsis sp.]MCU1684190.1 hypothetical protein [Amycolatopsis sp.]
MTAEVSAPKSTDTLVVGRLLLVLTVVTGVVDAVSFLGLGQVFVANMTGNVVFLGFAVAGRVGLSVIGSITAIFSFLLGALLGGRLAVRAPDRWFRLLKRAAMIQVPLLVVAIVLAATVDVATPSGAEPLLVVLGVAMGLQNATVQKIGLPDLTTTVLTRIVTGFAADSRLAGGPGSHPWRKLAAIGAMLLGAVGGGLLQLHVAMWPALLLAALLALGVGGTAFRFDALNPAAPEGKL